MESELINLLAEYVDDKSERTKLLESRHPKKATPLRVKNNQNNIR